MSTDLDTQAASTRTQIRSRLIGAPTVPPTVPVDEDDGDGDGATVTIVRTPAAPLRAEPRRSRRRSRSHTSIRHRIEVFRLYRCHRDDPEPFYRAVAADAAARLDERYRLTGLLLLDLGCGPGHYLDALRLRGATVVGVEHDIVELLDGDRTPTGAMVGDGRRLPFADGTFDGVVCSNMLEHTPDASAPLTEIARVLRPDGWAYVSWTPWYSPWGGHDMNPYQYLGPRLGPWLYERRHGPPRKNRYGEALWATYVGRTLALVGSMNEYALERAEPRYWPRLRALVQLPGVREFAAGNCVMYLRRRSEPGGAVVVRTPRAEVVT
jgi:SAM-dependent methyltransferase